NRAGELSNCVLSGDLPCTVAAGGRRRPAAIAFSLDLRSDTAARPGPDRRLRLSLVLDGDSYQVTDDWFVLGRSPLHSGGSCTCQVNVDGNCLSLRTSEITS